MPATEALATARGRLRDIALLCLLLVPVELALLALLKQLRSDSRGLVWDLADLWSGRLALLLPLAAAAFGLAALAVRLLPGGREAAALEPLRPWRRRGRPVRISLAALALAFGLLAGGGFAAIEAARGGLALAGAGSSFTIGTDAFVVERRRNYRGRVTIYAQAPGGRVALEGGNGRDGERYVTFPEHAARAWRADLRGWLILLVPTALAIAALAAAAFVLAGQLRRLRSGRADRPPAGRPPAAVIALWGGAVALALALCAAALARQADGYDERATIDVAALDALGVDGPLRLRAAPPPPGAPAAVAARAIAAADPSLPADLLLSARVARYADPAAAQAAARAWGAAERHADRRPIAIEGAVAASADDARETLRMARAVGALLVVVELAPGATDGVVVAVGRDAVDRTLAPSAGAVLAATSAAAPRLLDARLAWWR